jgi:uncharacterized protein (DUF433 family)
VESFIVIDPEILSGTPVFAGTRVPIKNLFDYLAANSSIGEFVDDFPTVRHETVISFLKFLETQTTDFHPAA